MKAFDWCCSPDSLHGSGCIFFEILLIWGLDVTAYGNIQHLIKKHVFFICKIAISRLAIPPLALEFQEAPLSCRSPQPVKNKFDDFEWMNLISFFSIFRCKWPKLTKMTKMHRHTRLNRWSPPLTSPSWLIIKTFLAKLWSVSPLSEHRPWLKKSNYHRPAPKSWS